MAVPPDPPATHRSETPRYHYEVTDHTELTSILERLAAGDIDTAEASRLIDALGPVSQPADAAWVDAEVVEADEAVGPPRDAGEPRPPFGSFLRETIRRAQASSSRPSAPQVDRLMVRGVGRRVRITGDESVATVSVEGPHVLRRNGNVIEVTSDGDIGPSFDGFSLIRPPHTVDDFRNLSLGKQLVVRVNPAIPVDAEVTGGSLKVAAVPVLGKVRVSAGAMRCADVTQVEDCLVQMGTATIAGTFARGRSRVRVESGNLTVRLAPDSDVTVRADAQLGGVSWPGERAYDEYVIGQGTARLDLAAVMGHVAIRQDLTPEEETAAATARAQAKAAADDARAKARLRRLTREQAMQAARAAGETVEAAVTKVAERVVRTAQATREKAATDEPGDGRGDVPDGATAPDDETVSETGAREETR